MPIMTSNPGPDPCSCGSGPVVVRCGAGHVERITPTPAVLRNRKARCPHREPGASGRCGRLVYVRAAELRAAGLAEAAQPPAPAAAPGPPGGGLWPGEAPAAPWRDLPGAAAPGTGAWCAERACPCGAPDMRYTNGSTTIACPDPRCADCWDVSPAAIGRADRHQEQAEQHAARARRAAPVPAGQMDALRRELWHVKCEMRRQVAAQLADEWLADESRDALEWFDAELAAADTTARAQELAGQLADLEVTRVTWWRRRLRVVPGELDDDDPGEDNPSGEDDSQDQDGTPVPAAELPAAAPPRAALPAPPRAGGVVRGGAGGPCCMCAREHGGAIAAILGIQSSDPAWLTRITGQPEPGLCSGHFVHVRTLADGAGCTVQVATEYDPREVASILATVRALPGWPA